MPLLSLQPTPFSTSLTLIVPPHVGPLTPKCHTHRLLGYIGVLFVREPLGGTGGLLFSCPSFFLGLRN